HATVGAGRHEAGRRRFGVEAAVARPVLGPEDRRLALEAEDAAVYVGLAKQHASVVHQIAGREVVRAVNDHVVWGEHIQGVFGGERELVGVYLHVWVDVQDAG